MDQFHFYQQYCTVFMFYTYSGIIKKYVGILFQFRSKISLKSTVSFLFSTQFRSTTSSIYRSLSNYHSTIISFTQQDPYRHPYNVP